MFRNLSVAVLVSAVAVAAAAPAFAQSVGVTSATAGGPLGKPPTERERVLQVGIDVKASELITTGANDRAHLVFLDGTALTVGPMARVTIDRFVYDQNSKLGDLAITATQGVFRLVGGKISKNRAITIATPSGNLGIRGGILMFTVTPTQTVSTMVFGWEMTVLAAGRVQSVKAPGWQVVTQLGQAPAPPRQLSKGELAATMSQLEAQPGQGNGSNVATDQLAKDSGFSDMNSGPGPNTGPTFIQGGPMPVPTHNNNTAITDAMGQRNFKFDKKY